MRNLEKVIKALECCKDINKLNCDDCPYTYNARSDRCECTAEMAFDALELLKEQEPRVMTLEEVTGGGECWIESKNGACGYCDCYLCEGREAVEVWRCMEQQPSYVPWFTYGKVWRCWTARPTDEQRKAAKWDADISR